MNNLMLMPYDALLTEALCLQKENAALKESHETFLTICIEFCRKVECGKARSVRTYQQMKAAIEKVQGETQKQLGTPSSREPLSDEKFLQWLLNHDNKVLANNYAALENTNGISMQWRLHGWVKSLKKTLDEANRMRSELL